MKIGDTVRIIDRATLVKELNFYNSLEKNIPPESEIGVIDRIDSIVAGVVFSDGLVLIPKEFLKVVDKEELPYWAIIRRMSERELFDHVMMYPEFLVDEGYTKAREEIRGRYQTLVNKRNRKPITTTVDTYPMIFSILFNINKPLTNFITLSREDIEYIASVLSSKMDEFIVNEIKKGMNEVSTR